MTVIMLGLTTDSARSRPLRMKPAGTITQVAADIPEEGSNSFIMYLSGIDTYWSGLLQYQEVM